MRPLTNLTRIYSKQVELLGFSDTPEVGMGGGAGGLNASTILMGLAILYFIWKTFL